MAQQVLPAGFSSKNMVARATEVDGGLFLKELFVQLTGLTGAVFQTDTLPPKNAVLFFFGLGKSKDYLKRELVLPSRKVVVCFNARLRVAVHVW